MRPSPTGPEAAALTPPPGYERGGKRQRLDPREKKAAMMVVRLVIGVSLSLREGLCVSES